MIDLSRAIWRKSSRSNAQGQCVEVAQNLTDSHGVVLVRDSKNRQGPVLEYTSAEWNTFVNAVKNGEFDLT